MLSPSQIVKFFDYQYLRKGSDNILDFLPGDRQQWRSYLQSGLVKRIQPGGNMPRFARVSLIGLGGMARLKQTIMKD